MTVEWVDLQPVTEQPDKINWAHCWACADDSDLAAAHREEDRMAEARTNDGPTGSSADYHLTFSFDCEDRETARIIADYVTGEIRKRVPIPLTVVFEAR